MPFTLDIKIQIALILKVPIEDKAGGPMSILLDRLTEIEGVMSGAFIQPITDLVKKYIALRDSAIAPLDENGDFDLDTILAGNLIQADVLKWSDKNSVSTTIINQLRALHSDIQAHINLPPGIAGSSNSRSIRLVNSSATSLVSSGYYDDQRLIRW